ncbi:MAG: hypothetical protein RJA22_3075 [Verrucomicrobiota bacterium]
MNTSPPTAPPPCFHCGLPCPTQPRVLEGRSFCCAGCEAVFSLLTGSGLGRYYELNAAPGRRVTAAERPARWAFLDEPAVRARLLDFEDGRQARVTFHLPAIHCVACVWLLENLFRLHPAVGRSTVNFGRREASLLFVPGQIRLSELAALLESIGYEPELTLGALDGKAGRAAVSPARRRQWMQVGLAGFGFGNIMLMSLPLYLGLDSFNGPWFRALAGWLGLALALPVVTYSAQDYWRAAWTSVRRRLMTLDVPIALGLAAIYGQSLYEVATRTGEGYCDSLTGLVFLLLCGRLFQQKTHERLAFDRDYRGFFPLAVVRLRGAAEESVAIANLVVGDRLRIRHGELVPADARLVAGEGCVDYSFVTGESEPVARAVGDTLHAGGRQVGGAIEVETVKPVSESYLTSLWNSDAFCKPRRDDLDTVTNRYSRRFTVVVMAIAVGAALFWWFRDPAVAMKAFTSVLIVACPCALALAAPITLGTAHRLLAGRGIYLRNALVVERLAEVDVVALDKTGTLTCPGSITWHGAAGDPLGAAEDQAVRSLARQSAHPLAARMGEGLAGPALPVEGFRETPGCGAEGCVGGREVWLGSAAWFRARGLAPDGAPSGSAVQVAMDGRWRGWFQLENVLRPEVEQMLAQLRGHGALALVSGDHDREAPRFRELLGPEAPLRFQQSPMDKLAFVQSLQQSGRRVMMVGDGLNDAGALRQADVGVAVVERVGAFSPASDVILDAAELPRLPQAPAFARQAVQVVRAGFLVSGLYNVVGVGIAAAGLLSPLVCAVLMPVSSVTVVLLAAGATRWMARRSGLLDTRAAVRRAPRGAAPAPTPVGGAALAPTHPLSA